MTHQNTSLLFLERATRAQSASNKTGTAYVKCTVAGFVNHKPASSLHDSVKVTCQLCEGRRHYVDIIDRDGRRIVTRHACPACKGKGWIDLRHGPLTDDVMPHEAFIASLIASAQRTHILPAVVCENCGGEGGWLEPCGRFDLCPCCEGTGELPSSEHELISFEDLDAINRDKPAEADPC